MQLGMRVVEWLVQPEFLHQVNVSIVGLNNYPQSGLIGDSICIAIVAKNEVMEEAVTILHAGMVRNNMGLFA